MKPTLRNILLASSLALIMAGCGSDEPKPKKKAPQGFQTNQTHFVNVPDKKSPTKEQRNAWMEEFIDRSNMQCQQYLANPISQSSETSDAKSQLYSTMFDGVSMLFGIKGITDNAKAIYNNANAKESQETQLAYEKALSPEIIRGVEIAREKHAQQIRLNQYRLIESYTIPMLRKDMKKYDKLCNHEIGLIEINNILKDANKPKSITPFSPKLTIDALTIKNKIEAVTIEEESKKKTSSQKK